eukprot:1009052-Amphidinium_carterae.1
MVALLSLTLVQNQSTLAKTPCDWKPKLHVAPSGCHLTKLRLHTKDTITAVMERLKKAKGNMSNQAFDELQTQLGWTLIDGSLMQSKRLEAILD